MSKVRKVSGRGLVLVLRAIAVRTTPPPKGGRK